MAGDRKKAEARDYRGYIRYKLFVILVLVLLVITAALISIGAGAAGISLRDVALTLLGQGTEGTNTIILRLRLPRVVTSMVAGVGLALTGCAMQALMRNPLASDSTIGVSQGAAFGAAFAIVVLGAGVQYHTNDAVSITNPYIVPLCAFVFSMVATLVVLALSRMGNITPESIVLSGVALSALFGGGTTIMQYFADDVSLSSIVFWTFGDMGRTSWKHIAIMAVVTAASSCFFFCNRWNFNALQSGENSAKGLGVNVDRLRIVGMTVCSFTSAVIVSFVGIINFVGLVSPHFMRRIIGDDYRYLMPASALGGALMLLISDTVARLVVAPIVLPIGAITSFVGAPLFLYLLYKGVKRQ